MAKKLVAFDFDGVLVDTTLTGDTGLPPLIKNSLISLANKYTLSIVSSTHSSTIADILRREDAYKYFNEILGADFNESKEVKLKKLLGDHLVSPKDCVFITDTLGDILEANQAGIPSIAVSWGLHDRSTFAEGSPAAIIDDPNDLIPIIEQILGK